ncbi:MAG: hypothetical protein ACXVO1_09400, partial [Tumebacillaceae bacterium]
MKKTNSGNLKKILTVLTVMTTLFGTSATAFAGTTPTVNTADMVTKASKATGLSTSVIQQYMKQGYNLSDVLVAHAIAKNSHTDIKQTLETMHKKLITSSKQLKAPANDLKYPAGQKPSGKMPVRTQKTSSATSSSITTADTSTTPTVAEQMDTAPYKVTLNGSNVSPLTGAVSIDSTDMTLIGKNGFNFSLTRSYNGDSAQFYNYNSQSIDVSYNEKLFNLGSGWSWNMSSIETDTHTNTKYLHLAGAGSYKIVGSTSLTIPSYPWSDVTIATDAGTVTVNGVASAYVVKSVRDGKKQYFDSNGKLIQISDKYGNWVQFKYGQIDT